MSDVERVKTEYVRVKAALPLLDDAGQQVAAQAFTTMFALLDSFAGATRTFYSADDVHRATVVRRLWQDIAAQPSWPALAVDRRSAGCFHAAQAGRHEFEATGNEQLLEDAISQARAAVDHATQARRMRGVRAQALASVLGLLRHDVTGNAIAGQLVDAERRRFAWALPDALTCLADHLSARFDMAGDRADIDAALTLTASADTVIDEAEQTTSRGETADQDAVRHAREWLSRVRGAAALLRFKRYGDAVDVEQAVTWLRRALALSEAVSCGAALDGLGCALLARRELPGHGADLDEAIEVLERAVAQDDASPWFATNLAVALSTRHHIAGAIADNRRAQQLYEQALAVVPERAPERQRIMANFTAAKGAERAIDDARAVVQATRRGARARPARLGALAGSLLDDAERHLRILSLEDSLTIWRQALAETPPGSPDEPSLRTGLGRALRVRYCLLGDPADLASAEDTLIAAVGQAGGRERAEAAGDLALARSLTAARTGTPRDIAAASTAFEQAVLAATDIPEVACDTAREWSRWAAERADWPTAARAASLALEALHSYDLVQAERTDREQVLRRTSGVAAQAAVAHVRAGDAELAVTCLERGRLRLVNEALAPNAGTGGDDRAELAVIRTLAAELPLVYLASGDAGSVVIAVSRAGQVTGRLLPELRSSEVTWRVAGFASAQLARGADPQRWRTVLQETANWLGTVLWSHVLEMIADELAGRDDAEIGVVPHGLLALLPLHAAARPDPDDVGRVRYAIDDCLVRIVPSARIVADRRADWARRSPRPRSVLVADVADSPGYPHLEQVEREGRAVRDAFGRGLRLSGADATRAAVLEAVGRHDVLHLACHGRADILDARESALLLADGSALTVGDLQGADIRTRVAVLSACQSAVYGAAAADEMIGLPVGLLHAGAAGVVATLWEVNDVSAMLLVRRFYAEWEADPGRPAAALRAAQLWLREATNEEERVSFPDVQLPEPVDRALRVQWRRARPHAGLHHWATFTYLGW